MKNLYLSFNKRSLKKNAIISIGVLLILASLVWGGIFLNNRIIYRNWTNELIELAEEFVEANELTEAIAGGNVNRITFLELVEAELLVAPILHPTNFRIIELCNYILVNPEFEYEVVIVDECVVQTQMPFIYLMGNPVMEISVGGTFNDPGAFAFDADGTNISSQVVVRNNINTNRPGIYQVTYDVTSSGGIRAAQVIRTVRVR